jgi:hypothetical protein
MQVFDRYLGIGSDDANRWVLGAVAIADLDWEL